MSSVKGKLLRVFGGLGALRESRVTAAETIAPGFRRLRFSAEGLRVQPGDKLQILLPSDDVRTYTPLPTEGGVELVGWCDAGGPGARWFSDAQVGATVLSPSAQRSLTLPAGPVILVGDETSVGVAASFAQARPGQVQAVFQAGAMDALRAAAEVMGVSSVHVAPRGDLAGVVDAIADALTRLPGAVVGLTGGSALVVDVRAALRARGVTHMKLKTYWVPGKTGLD